MSEHVTVSPMYFLLRFDYIKGQHWAHIFFTLVMVEITKDIQGDIPWCMLFADDVVLIDESEYRF
jgi:hypothetical protein